jgi:hypothetical protein
MAAALLWKPFHPTAFNTSWSAICWTNYKTMEPFERRITEQEAAKGHITIVQRERYKFERHFGKLLHEDDTSGKEADFYKPFFRKDTRRTIRLKLCMRNNPRRELRLYLSKTGKDGYRISGNRILVVEFEKGRALISSRPVGLRYPEKLYPKKSATAKLRRPKDEEGKLNALVHREPRQLTARERAKWATSARLARECLEAAGFDCEVGWTGNRFKSKASGRTYTEVHHLIPLKYQKQFRKSLDTMLNLCCLSPQAHRAIHHGTDEQVIQLLQHLLQKRPALKKQFQISEDILFRMYGVE